MDFHSKPLYVDTKPRSSGEVAGRGNPPTPRKESHPEAVREEAAAEEHGCDPPGTAAGLLMVRSEAGAEPEAEASREKPPDRPRAVTAGSSVEDAAVLPFRIPPPPLASIDVDEEFLFTEPLPPPLEFANSFESTEDPPATPSLCDLLRRGPATSAAKEGAFSPALADRKKALGQSEPPREAAADSGIEEADSHSDHRPLLETMSTVSTVSSISTLSSEAADTCTVCADGHTFQADKPPVPPKPRVKSLVGKSHRDAPPEENLDGVFVPPPPPVPPETLKSPQQRTSKLWGDGPEVKVPADAKANVISELNSILQQMNKEKVPKPPEALDSPSGARGVLFATRVPDGVTSSSGVQRNATVTFTIRPGSNQPITVQNRTSDFDSMTILKRAPSPVASPTDAGPAPRPSSLPTSALSPTLSDGFGFQSPPIPGEGHFGSQPGRSRSPSPSTLQQPVSNKPFASKGVLLWTKHDVADWLDTLNLGEHKDAFLDNEIDGTHLPSLQKEDLIDLGVTRVGHRMNIERALKLLQSDR